MDDRRGVRLAVAGGALLIAAIVVLGGSSPSQDLVFERAQNDIDTLPSQFDDIGMMLPAEQTRHAGILRDVDYWVGRAATGSTCLFVLPRDQPPEAACGSPVVTLHLADGTQAVYPVPDDTDDADGILVGGVVLVERDR